jgi:hypothetical protein
MRKTINATAAGFSAKTDVASVMKEDLVAVGAAGAAAPVGATAAREEVGLRPQVADLPLARTSEILRGILRKNPGVKTFSVRRILSAIGDDRFEAALMMFSIPAIVPVPGGREMAAMPAGVIACQLVSGRRRIKLPGFLLNKAVSRRALAVALHAIVPALEAAEKVLRPRWSWVGHASARRAIGLFVILLALALAQPFLGFSVLNAMAIFITSLGMAEQDGLAVLVGVAIGLSSLAMLAASCGSGRALRSKAGAWVRKMARRFGLLTFAKFLDKRGYDRLARIVRLRSSDLLLLWNPEKRGAPRSRRASAPTPATTAAHKREATTSRSTAPDRQERARQAA